MRRVVQGYVDFGGIRIPPLPLNIILTDRDDGTLWYLTYNTTEPSSDDEGYISITDTLPTNTNHNPQRIFEAYDELYIFDNWDRPMLRLFVRGGYLGYETVTRGEGEAAISNTPTFARKGLENTYRKIYTPSDWHNHNPEGYTLAWAPV